MSVSLIVLRLETRIDFPLLSLIDFTASKYLTGEMEKSRIGKKENEETMNCRDSGVPEKSLDADVGKTPKQSASEIQEDIIKKHRGSREWRELTVETIKIEEENDPKFKEIARQTSIKSSKSSKESTPDAMHSVFGNTIVERKMVIPSMNKLQFYSGNHFVEQTKGILHLYKENKLTPLGEEAERSELICVLSVPTSMTTHELLQFTGPFNEDIEHIRLIRDGKPNLYMVLLKFKNQKSADGFYTNFNGVAFNSIEPEVCHLVYVAKVEAILETENACLPISGHTELPTCPVCLERMDESVEGILTILCNHSFHRGCLDQWGDNSCPVCRYSQVPETISDNRCFECGSEQESLWICVVCGHLGCGRYVRSHAYGHYTETGHTFAMQIGSNNRVWDYAGDNYVHRLLHNKADGKPVEVQCNFHTNDEKVDAVQLEYTYLLTNQLETQRRYFEENIGRIEKESQMQIEEILDANRATLAEKVKLEAEHIELKKEKQTTDKKITKLQAKLTNTISEFQDEKEMNEGLRKNQTIWSDKLKAMDDQLKAKSKSIDELQEQVRDLMFFLEAKEKLKNVADVTNEEIESSRIELAASSKTRAKNKKK